MLLSAAQTIHWFNPFVWLMNNQAENDIEMACDQRLLKGQSKEVRAVYGRMIVDVIRQTRLPIDGVLYPIFIREAAEKAYSSSV